MLRFQEAPPLFSWRFQELIPLLCIEWLLPLLCHYALLLSTFKYTLTVYCVQTISKVLPSQKQSKHTMTPPPPHELLVTHSAPLPPFNKTLHPFRAVPLTCLLQFLKLYLKINIIACIDIHVVHLMSTKHSVSELTSLRIISRGPCLFMSLD